VSWIHALILNEYKNSVKEVKYILMTY